MSAEEDTSNDFNNGDGSVGGRRGDIDAPEGTSLTGESAEEDGPKEAAITAEASTEGEEQTTCRRYLRRKCRRRRLEDGPEGYKTTMAESAEEDRDKNGGIDGGRGVENSSEGSETTPEVAADRRLARGIYNDYGDVGGGKRACRL